MKKFIILALALFSISISAKMVKDYVISDCGGADRMFCEGREKPIIGEVEGRVVTIYGFNPSKYKKCKSKRNCNVRVSSCVINSNYSMYTVKHSKAEKACRNNR